MSMNAHHCYGIITNDYEKAKELMQTIIQSRDDVVKYINKDRLIVEFENGEVWRWTRSDSTARGYRFHKALIDRDTPIEVLQNVIMPLMYSDYIEWI